MADYLYSSARVRVLERALIGRERIAALLETKSADGAWALLREYGVEPLTDDNGKILREETLLRLLRNAYAEACEMLPDVGALRLWLYPYDCNNVKAAIKCFERGLDPSSMLFDFGTVEAQSVCRMVRSGGFDGLPDAMKQAAADAISAYAKNKNPQQIDLLLDRACYADMLTAAEKCGSDYVVGLVKRKIDLTNLLICVRILRMKSGEIGKMLWKDSVIEGGTLSRETLDEWFAKGEDKLWERLYYTAYTALAKAVLAGDGSLTCVERCCDNCLMDAVREAKSVPYGVEVVVAFLLAHEYEVRNLRILLAGKDASLSRETIRERIRDSYV